MKKLAAFSASLIIILCLAGLAWTQNLKQINEETIFLTEESRQEYAKFKDDFHIRSLVVGKGPRSSLEPTIKLIRKLCQETCEVIDHRDLPKKPKNLKLLNEINAAFLLVQKEDATRTDFKKALKDILEMPEAKNLDFSGIPYTNILLDQYSEKVKTTIFPSLFAGVFLLLLLYLRSLPFAVILFFAGLMGASLSLSGTKAFLDHSNLITAIIPLLLFVVQISMVLHIHATAMELRSLKRALIEKLEPIGLMVVTTFIGFGSLYFSDLYAISQFGLYTALFLLLSTCLSYLWLFSLSLLMPKLWSQEKRETSLKFVQKFLTHFWSVKKIILFCTTSLILGLISLKRIPIITDATRYFPKETLIREKMIQLAEEFIGSPLAEVIITVEEGNYPQLQKLSLFEERLEQELKGTIISANQLVKLANLNYSGEDKVPDNKFAYIALKGQIPAVFNEGYPSGNSYRLTYLGAPENVDQYEQDLEIIKKHLESAGFTLKFNGLNFHLMRAQSRMIVTLFKSFFLSLVLISLLSFIYYKNIKIFFVFMTVNVVPVLASFPLLWLFGLSFNIATVMTYSISLGLIVDSSYHIVHGLNQKDFNLSFFVKSVLQPIVGASAMLTTCFILFTLSDFLPIREFGQSLATLIILGMILDLKVLPGLIFNKSQA